MAVPYTFGSATTSIPLSQLDSNFATTITLGNTAIQLGNTVTTLNNMTLGNVTISSGTSNIQTNVANATGVLIEANGGTGTTTGYYGFKNRIINGAMVISQRNGTTDTPISAVQYAIDRWRGLQFTDGGISIEQSSTAPAGFTNSMKCTITSADTSLAAGQLCGFNQFIEGYNTADLGWGTANASTVTLSFWVRSSLTGTFAGAFRNSATDRSYIFTYTISSANTFEYKTITVAGDTSGTWLTTNGTGIDVVWSLGVGSNYQSTAGSWQTTSAFATSGAVSVIGTLNATFYITGVQLEKGSTATSFDYRPYGTELQLCQRYYEVMENASMYGAADNSTNFIGMYRYLVEKRAAPTGTLLVTNPSISEIAVADRTGSGSTLTGTIFGTKSMRYSVTGFSSMTAKNPLIGNGSTTGIVGLSAEL